MASVSFSGEWFLLVCDTKFIAIHSKETRQPFVFDCSTAERKPRDNKADNISDGSDTASDKILAFAVSPTGKWVALIDDTKRLVLFQCEQSWNCISTRWVVRRCTSLVFSRAEDEVLVADKSGDVYSFSVVEHEKEGELKMGHLSMVLSVTMSLDDKYIITGDRDEKIRVSHLNSPYNIQAFCLGHQEFVSALLVPSGHPEWLLSGSGDGTMKVWEFTSGRRLQSWDLKELEEACSSESDKDKKPTVRHIVCSPNGQHVAVQCERVSRVHFFSLDQERGKNVVPHSRLSLPFCPLDMTFDAKGRLWVLMNSNEAPLQIYKHRQSSWECDVDSPELILVTEVFNHHWKDFDASRRAASHYEHLHKESYDNMTAYLEKKQHRLEEQQQRKKIGQNTVARKKAKLETTGTVTESST